MSIMLMMSLSETFVKLFVDGDGENRTRHLHTELKSLLHNRAKVDQIDHFDHLAPTCQSQLREANPEKKVGIPYVDICQSCEWLKKLVKLGQM